MSGAERHQRRNEVARDAGFRGVQMPEDPVWAGIRLHSVVDERAADAERLLRGLPVNDSPPVPSLLLRRRSA